jgi:urease accessory protein
MPRDAAIPVAAWRARLALDFEQRGARTVLAARSHDGPLVVQKPLYPEGDSPAHAIVVHPPAGIAGGDELVIDVCARPNAHALLTTPGAARWYRSAGPWARQRVSIEAHAGATVEWLPQETIVFDGAMARIGWEARIAGDGRLIAWDVVRLGRTACGERFDNGRFRLESRIVRDGKVAWLERARIEPGGNAATALAALAGEPVFGTLLAASPHIGDETLARCRDIPARSGIAAVTRLPSLLVARYRGRSAADAHAYFFALWSILRPVIAGREAVAPRIWST